MTRNHQPEATELIPVESFSAPVYGDQTASGATPARAPRGGQNGRRAW